MRTTNGDQPAITPVEIARRRTALEQAEHSGNMEGIYISAGARADGEDYVNGRIGVDELLARGRARYGLN